MPSSIDPQINNYNLKELGLSKEQSKRLARCGQRKIYSNGHLVSAVSCNLAVCPRCAARRDIKRQQAIESNLREILADIAESGRHLVYYSVTLKSPHDSASSDARRLLRSMHQKFTKMQRTKTYKALGESGYVRAHEVKKTGADSVYPHSHLLLAFDAHAFDLYTLHERLAQYYGRDGYHVQSINTTAKYSDLDSAIIGFARYISKGVCSVIGSFKQVYGSFFSAMSGLLKGLRRYSAGGIFHSVLAPLESDGGGFSDGEIIELICSKTKSVTRAVYDSALGLWGSLGIGRRRKKKPPTPTKSPPALVPRVRASSGANNRVAAVLDAFERMTSEQQRKARESNAYYRAKWG